MLHLLHRKSPDVGSFCRSGLVASTRDFVDFEVAVDFSDGDALVVAAVVRGDDELLAGIIDSDEKLLVRVLVADVERVLASAPDVREIGAVVLVAYFHVQIHLRVVHNHCAWNFRHCYRSIHLSLSLC